MITTVPDPAAARAPDLLDRESVAPAPNRAWSPTSHTSRPGRASSMPRSSWTPSHVALAAGPRRCRRRPDSSWTP
ncbi:protein of unknown function [Streptantibioticus cattleyicolor NRRL 8057 = DSM 46488]|nr:protein of unknown function [Streptantibioticus cattleyicolor NRRL 8057 = DSM 46488]